MKVDIHTHILPPEIPKFKDIFGYGGFIELQHDQKNCCANMYGDDGKFFRKVEPNCYSAEPRLSDCKNHSVDVQVLSTVPVMFSYWTKPQDGEYVSKYLNDHIVSVVTENPKNFIALGTLPMQAPDLAIKELQRLKKLNVPGIQIGSHINDLNLDSPELFPIFEACESLGMAIFVHPWDMMGSQRMQKYWLPWLVGMPAETSLAICSMIFGGVFEKLPKLKVAFAHGGGSFPMTIGRIQHGFDVRPDLCAIDNKTNPRDYLGKFYLDSLVHDPMVLKYIVELMGENRICLGTDYPFPLGELAPGKLIEDSSFTKTVKEKLLAHNAFDWLGLDINNY
ncbi:MAG: amidohydrolase [Halobacteriovoraceae bacterium]|jgi:aminocarboxymuconate-semialdehyde decarboxylase|nr:amidohydrolase [Halobacteriovoraceae bacterium]MBT5093777.1 amidohydrolase [Halobacteriovoraceae bacterium]